MEPVPFSVLKKGDDVAQDQQLNEFLSLVDVENFDNVYHKDIGNGKYFGMPLSALITAEKRLRLKEERSIAYFSMEYGLASSFYNKFQTSREISQKNKSFEHEVFSNYRLADYFFSLKLERLVDLPIYSGGLGVLAGDTIKTMADYRLSAVGIGMLWNIGYFKQKFWFKYGQAPEAMHWDMYSYPGLIPLKNRIKISLKSSDLYLKLWKYYLYSYKLDYAVPIILLDANLEENEQHERRLTDQLYKSEGSIIQIMQRVILGMGGAVALTAMDYNIDVFHLNEGHAVFAFIEKARGINHDEIVRLSNNFVYTCHTPVAAGHDRYSREDLAHILKPEDLQLLEALGKDADSSINLTLVSMNAAAAMNTVSRSHRNVMRIQFPKYQDKIQCVTNGVHAPTWISDRFKDLFERYLLTGNDSEPKPLRLEKVNALKNSQEFRTQLWQAHQDNKSDLCNLFEKWKLDKDIFTFCWARRIAAYKRPAMILQDCAALIDLAKKVGPIQIILAGKAHPNDNLGFTYINQILDKIDSLANSYDLLKIIMLENYDIFFAKMLVSSVDMWLNNPLPPFEASGTSGMKAILNGVLQLSTVDGWIAEAQQDGIGKFFGYRFDGNTIGSEHNLRMEEDSKDLYQNLKEMMRLYYATNNKGNVDVSSVWIDMMINCISTGSQFNTYRMLDEYRQNIWKLGS